METELRATGIKPGWLAPKTGYLNHAAVSPLLRRCREYMEQYLDELTRNGALHYPDFVWQMLAETRQPILGWAVPVLAPVPGTPVCSTGCWHRSLATPFTFLATRRTMAYAID